MGSGVTKISKSKLRERNEKRINRLNSQDIATIAIENQIMTLSKNSIECSEQSQKYLKLTKTLIDKNMLEAAKTTFYAKSLFDSNITRIGQSLKLLYKQLDSIKTSKLAKETITILSASNNALKDLPELTSSLEQELLNMQETQKASEYLKKLIDSSAETVSSQEITEEQFALFAKSVEEEDKRLAETEKESNDIDVEDSIEGIIKDDKLKKEKDIINKPILTSKEYPINVNEDKEEEEEENSEVIELN